MSLRNYFKKLGKHVGNATRSRGRINHRRDMRAASKAIRRDKKEFEEHLKQVTKDAFDRIWDEKLDELFNEQLTIDYTPDMYDSSFDLITDEEPH